MQNQKLLLVVLVLVVMVIFTPRMLHS